MNNFLAASVAFELIERGYLAKEELLNMSDSEYYEMMKNGNFQTLIDRQLIESNEEGSDVDNIDQDKKRSGDIRNWAGSRIDNKEGEFNPPSDIAPLINAVNSGDEDEASRLGWVKPIYFDKLPEEVKHDGKIALWLTKIWEAVVSLGKCCLYILGLDKWIIPWLNKYVGNHNGFRNKLIFPVLVAMGYDDVSYDLLDYKLDYEVKDSTALATSLQMTFPRYYPCVHTAAEIRSDEFVDDESVQHYRKIYVVSDSERLVVRDILKDTEISNYGSYDSVIYRSIDKLKEFSVYKIKSIKILGKVYEVINPTLNPVMFEISGIDHIVASNKLYAIPKYVQLACYSIKGYTRCDIALLEITDYRGLTNYRYILLDATSGLSEDSYYLSSFLSIC